MFRISIVLFSFLLLISCGDENTSYNFDVVVTKKFVDEKSSEPLHLMLEVSLNEGDAKSVECRIKNILRPMWTGLRKGAKLNFKKSSSFDYSEATICGLLNKSKVKDVLGQVK